MGWDWQQQELKLTAHTTERMRVIAFMKVGRLMLTLHIRAEIPAGVNQKNHRAVILFLPRGGIRAAHTRQESPQTQARRAFRGHAAP